MFEIRLGLEPVSTHPPLISLIKEEETNSLRSPSPGGRGKLGLELTSFRDKKNP